MNNIDTSVEPLLTHANRLTLTKILKNYGWIFLIVVLFLLQRFAANTPTAVERFHISFFREQIVGVLNFLIHCSLFLFWK